MASRDIKDCVPALQIAWDAAHRKWKEKYPNRAEPFLTTTYRSNEEQTALYMNDKNGKDDDGDGKIDERDEWRTNAKAGQSKHNKQPSEAFDIAFRLPDKTLDWSEGLFKDFAEIIKPMGVHWGGDWVALGKAKNNDSPHFEV